MAWNPHTDQQNRAYAHILTTLFPEQTKTLPRIIIWSIIFLADLTIGVFAAVHFGWFSFDNYVNQNHTMFGGALLILGIIAVFWLQGVIWGAIVKLFQKKNDF